MAITLPRVIKSAAYRSSSGSGDCALTHSSSAGNFLAFGEVVTPPGSAPPVLPLFGRRYHTPSTHAIRAYAEPVFHVTCLRRPRRQSGIGFPRRKFATLHGNGRTRQSRTKRSPHR